MIIKTYICACDDFQENMLKIDRILIFASTHRIIYDGIEFEFCPWCGAELILKIQEIDE